MSYLDCLVKVFFEILINTIYQVGRLDVLDLVITMGCSMKTIQIGLLLVVSSCLFQCVPKHWSTKNCLTNDRRTCGFWSQCKQGKGEACVEVALHLARSSGKSTKEREKQDFYLRKGCSFGYQRACLMTGLRLWAKKRSCSTALQLFRNGCEKGHWYHCSTLGIFYNRFRRNLPYLIDAKSCSVPSNEKRSMHFISKTACLRLGAKLVSQTAKRSAIRQCFSPIRPKTLLKCKKLYTKREFSFHIVEFWDMMFMYRALKLRDTSLK